MGRRAQRLWAAAAVVAGILSFRGADLVGGGDGGLFVRMGRFLARLFPPDVSPAFLASLGRPLLQTLAVAGAGTFLGWVVAAALAPLASTDLMRRPWGAAGRPAVRDRLLLPVHLLARWTLAVLRGIPELLWVLICIVAVGFGPFAGALALGLHTGGVLGRLWAEALDETPREPLEVLEAAGASAPVRTLWGALPQARPLMVSHALLRWEFNLRVSVLVGFLGGGGLGLRLYNAVQLGFHDQVSTMVLVVFALVTLSDVVSNALRRQWLAPGAVRGEAAGAVDARLPIEARELAV